MKIKSLIVIIILLLTAALFAEDSKYIKFSEPEFNYYLMYPKTFDKMPIKETDKGMRLKLMDKGRASLIQVIAYDYSSKETKAPDAKDFLEFMEKLMIEENLLSEEKKTLPEDLMKEIGVSSSAVGLYIDYQQDSEKPLVSEIIVLSKGVNIYIFNVIFELKDRRWVEPVFKEIVKSFRITVSM